MNYMFLGGTLINLSEVLYITPKSTPSSEISVFIPTVQVVYKNGTSVELKVSNPATNSDLAVKLAKSELKSCYDLFINEVAFPQ